MQADETGQAGSESPDAEPTTRGRPGDGLGQDAPPELADVGRLARRLLQRAVTAARTEDAPVQRLLGGHLGAASSSVTGSGPLKVTDAHLNAALDQLLDIRSQLTRILLGGHQLATPPE